MATVNYLDDSSGLISEEKKPLITEFLGIINGIDGLTACSEYDPQYSDPRVTIASSDQSTLQSALSAISTWVQFSTNAANPPEYQIYRSGEDTFAANILCDDILKAAKPESFMEITDPWELLKNYLNLGMTNGTYMPINDSFGIE